MARCDLQLTMRLKGNSKYNQGEYFVFIGIKYQNGDIGDEVLATDYIDPNNMALTISNKFLLGYRILTTLTNYNKIVDVVFNDTINQSVNVITTPTVVPLIKVIPSKYYTQFPLKLVAYVISASRYYELNPGSDPFAGNPYNSLSMSGTPGSYQITRYILPTVPTNLINSQYVVVQEVEIKQPMDVAGKAYAIELSGLSGSSFRYFGNTPNAFCSSDTINTTFTIDAKHPKTLLFLCNAAINQFNGVLLKEDMFINAKDGLGKGCRNCVKFPASGVIYNTVGADATGYIIIQPCVDLTLQTPLPSGVTILHPSGMTGGSTIRAYSIVLIRVSQNTTFAWNSLVTNNDICHIYGSYLDWIVDVSGNVTGSMSLTMQYSGPCEPYGGANKPSL